MKLHYKNEVGFGVLAAGVILVWLAFIVGLVWVAAHFISKWW